MTDSIACVVETLQLSAHRVRVWVQLMALFSCRLDCDILQAIRINLLPVCMYCTLGVTHRILLLLCPGTSGRWCMSSLRTRRSSSSSL